MSVASLLDTIENMPVGASMRFGMHLTVTVTASRRGTRIWRVYRDTVGELSHHHSGWRCAAYIVVWINPETGRDRSAGLDGMPGTRNVLLGPKYSGRKPLPRGRAGNMRKILANKK